MFRNRKLHKSKLQYMKNIFHVAHLHIMLVLSTRNMFKDAKVIKSRGALGTGFTYALVWQSCGKPSTKFPHRWLVECLFIQLSSYRVLLQNFKFPYLSDFSKLTYFRNFHKFWDVINLDVVLRFSCSNTFILIFKIRLVRYSVGFLRVHRAKHCELDKILHEFTIFCEPQPGRFSCCFRMAIVRYILNFPKFWKSGTSSIWRWHLLS